VLQCLAVCVLQCFAVCCSVLQCVTVRCSVLRCKQCEIAHACFTILKQNCFTVTTHCNTPQHTATHRNLILLELDLTYTRVLQCVALCCSLLQCVAMCCTVLQCVAVWCCNVLQCVTMRTVCILAQNTPTYSAVEFLHLCKLGLSSVCVLLCDVVFGSVLQCVAACCSV